MDEETSTRPKKAKNFTHLNECKDLFHLFFQDDESGVFLLYGPYGSGKSEFVRRTILKEEEFRKYFQFSSEISLFGCRDLQNLEDRAIGSVQMGAKGPTAKNLDTPFKEIQKIIKPFIGGVDFQVSVRTAFWSLACSSPFLLIIDDVDRKMEELRLKEVLGFASMLSEQSGRKTKVVILLSSDNLEQEDSAALDQQREKAIDYEFWFHPQPEELAREYIKSPDLTSPMVEIFRAAKCPNIRLMIKVERHVLNLTKYLAGKSLEISQSEKKHAAQFAFLWYSSGKSFTIEDIQSCSLYQYGRTARHRLTEEHPPHPGQEALQKLKQDLGFSDHQVWDDFLFDFFSMGRVSQERLDAFKQTLPEIDQRNAFSLHESHVDRLLNHTFRDTTDEAVEAIIRGVNSFPTLHSVHRLLDYDRFLREIQKDPADMWRCWINSWTDAQEITNADIRVMRKFVPEEFIALLPPFKEQDRIELDPLEFLMKRESPNDWNGKHIDTEAVASLSSKDWQRALEEMEESCETKFKSVLGAVSEAIDDGIRGGHYATIARNLEKAVVAMAKDSTINAFRARTYFSRLLQRDSKKDL